MERGIHLVIRRRSKRAEALHHMQKQKYIRKGMVIWVAFVHMFRFLGSLSVIPLLLLKCCYFRCSRPLGE